MKERFLREERGFTLTEMMVTTVIMMVVLFALYSIFDMSLQVFSFGNNKVEAVESARIGPGEDGAGDQGRVQIRQLAHPAKNHLFFTPPTRRLA